MDAAVVSKYGLRVESKQYDSYYEARQEGSNCSDGSIVAGDPRHTACLRFGDAQDVYGNSEYAHVLKPQGLFTWSTSMCRAPSQRSKASPRTGASAHASGRQLHEMAW